MEETHKINCVKSALDYYSEHLLPHPEPGTHMGTARCVGAMQMKILAQGNATTSVASHSLIIQLVQLKQYG